MGLSYRSSFGNSPPPFFYWIIRLGMTSNMHCETDSLNLQKSSLKVRDTRSAFEEFFLTFLPLLSPVWETLSGFLSFTTSSLVHSSKARQSVHHTVSFPYWKVLGKSGLLICSWETWGVQVLYNGCFLLHNYQKCSWSPYTFNEANECITYL